MNNNTIADHLQTILEDAGIHVRHVAHPSSLRVEFTTSPPLVWSFVDCDRATDQIYSARMAGKPIGDIFSTDHDRAHSFWAFRLETYDLDPDLAPHNGRTLCAPE